MSKYHRSFKTTAETKGTIDNILIHRIATSQSPVSRTDLAKITGLSKMTIGKHISELIQKGLIVEQDSQALPDQKFGRHPIPLLLSNDSPCIFGVLIKRGYMQAILADISSNIIDMTKYHFQETLTRDELVALLFKQYDALSSRTKRRIIGCGIASMGPVNTVCGCILNPANFYGISDLPVVDILHAYTGLPTYLIHDANAGALVEKLYGRGVGLENFMYLHIEEGIGLGFVLNDQLFNGLSGQSGSIGHISVNINGPKCSCGNIGCLELYASLEQMQKKISELLPIFPESAFRNIKEPTWSNILNFAAKGDPIAAAALDEFCSYLAHALANSLKLLDFSTIIVGYDSQSNSTIIEKMLAAKLKNFYHSKNYNIKILHSFFDGSAPLLGSVAVVANEVFLQNIPL